jgi:hypothetical protein
LSPIQVNPFPDGMLKVSRYRALLGCAAIAVMVSLGLPSLTAMASDGTEPPPTAPPAEPLAEGSETPVPETTVPETPVPETTVPETPVPETTVPDTTVPETTAPDTTVPETTAPDTTVPDTAVPETTVPEGTEPEGTEVANGGTGGTVPTATASTATEAPSAATALGAEEASISLVAVVPQVFGVSATLTDDDQWGVKDRIVTISWSGTPGAEYLVERRLSTSGTWEWVGSTWDGSTSMTDRFGEWGPFGSYQYRVTPYIWDDEAGDYVYGSPGYVSVNVTRPVYPPSLPRAVRATRTNATVQVTWTAPTVNHDCQSTGYYYCDPATSYVVSWAAAGGTWQSVTTTATSRTISGLRSTIAYYVRVQAVNAAGRSGTTTSIRVGPLAKPSVMTPMRATPAIRQVTLRWTAPASNGSPIIRYAIQRRRAGSATWNYISTNTPATARSFTARNLANGTRYYFRIAAVNALGRGAWSAPIGALTASHRLDFNLILVGRALFTAADITETNAALAIARGIFARVGIYLRVAATFGITAAQAGANLTIDNDSEAADLTADWTFPNRALDLFVVRHMNGAAGWSAVDGSCNKNDNSYGQMTGSVASLIAATASTGVVFAHEMGHYLGLEHTYDTGNFMSPVAYPNATGIQRWQGDMMKRHCLVTRL